MVLKIIGNEDRCNRWLTHRIMALNCAHVFPINIFIVVPTTMNNIPSSHDVYNWWLLLAALTLNTWTGGIKNKSFTNTEMQECKTNRDAYAYSPLYARSPKDQSHNVRKHHSLHWAKMFAKIFISLHSEVMAWKVNKTYF